MNRRTFIKMSGMALSMAPAHGLFATGGGAVAPGRTFKSITIEKTACSFEIEPYIRPFGFKGGYSTGQWIVSS